MRSLLLLVGLLAAPAVAAPTYVVSWTAPAQGRYPAGTPIAQPDLSRAFPSPERGARDQTFRMVLRPDIWGRAVRIRFSNLYGDRAITLDDAAVGLSEGGGAVVSGSGRVVRFSGARRVVIAPGTVRWSDPVPLAFDRDMVRAAKLAVSFHFAGTTGPMSWHSKAMETSFVSAPDAGDTVARTDAGAVPFPTTSWYFVDAIEMETMRSTPALVAFGDSLTDGTNSTLNGDDRWADDLSRSLHDRFGNQLAVVNAGIGGNQVAGPDHFDPGVSHGGPSAGSRLANDVLDLAGVRAIIWLEGINDFSANGNASVGAVEGRMRDLVAAVHARHIKIVGMTVPSALGSNNPAHGSTEQDRKRRELNVFIRKSGIFDLVIDADSVLTDPATGALRSIFATDSLTGVHGDGIHPNHAGYLALAESIPITKIWNLLGR